MSPKSVSIQVSVPRSARDLPSNSSHLPYPGDDYSSPLIEGPLSPEGSASDRSDDDSEYSEEDEDDEDDEDGGGISPDDSASQLNVSPPQPPTVAPAKSDHSRGSSHRSVPPTAPEIAHTPPPEPARKQPRASRANHRQPRRRHGGGHGEYPYRDHYYHQRGHPDNMEDDYYYNGAYGHPQGHPRPEWNDVPHGPSRGHYPPQSVMSDPYHPQPPLHRHLRAPMVPYGQDPFSYHAQHYASNMASPVYASHAAPQGYFASGATPGPMAMMPYQVPQYTAAYGGYPPYMSQAPSSPPTTDKTDSSKDMEAQLKVMTEQMKAMELARVEREKAREMIEAEKKAALEAEAARVANEKKIAEGKAKAATDAKEAAEKEAADNLKKANDAHEKAIKEAKEAQEKAEKAAEAAKEETAKFKPSDDASMAPIKFKDAVGRKFSFPWGICKKWEGMEKLIQQAFLHVDVIGAHVQERHYDLLGPNGEIILPDVWETTVKPDWSITMHMWPLPEEEKKKKDVEVVPPAPPQHKVPTSIEKHRSSGFSFFRRPSQRKKRQVSAYGGGPPPPPGLVLEDPVLAPAPPPPPLGAVPVPEERKKKTKRYDSSGREWRRR